MTFYAGVDFGTSGARIAVVDAKGILCHQSSRTFGTVLEAALPDCWQETLFSLLRGIESPQRRELAAIAVNGTSATVLLCDAIGNPVLPPLLYNDARAASAVEGLRQLFAQERYHNAPGQHTVLSATSSLVKLLWWSEQPAFTQARYLMHQADWLGFLLHGRLGVSDYHNSLKLGYDVVQLSYPDWLTSLAIAPLLPQVIAPGTPIGPVQPEVAAHLNIPSHCRVCAGTTDSIAAFLASGATEPGDAVTSLGSTLVLKLLSRTRVENNAYGIYSHRLGDRWLVGGASNTGGAVLQQFFTPSELATLSDRIPTEQASPLDYYPLLQPGERFPTNNPHLLPRLEPRPSDPVAFLHGLLESMSRIEAEGYRLLQTLGATPLTQIFTAGGGAENAAWTALRSRHLGVRVERSQQPEAAYGTARLALGLLTTPRLSETRHL
ncbi:MAG: FGGY-family carbohydrate kinase [Stenomitos rutilans HA7619-LM2]|jgi:sugar (pentulose or hexulose) kinase|nr:FGGY-family carbohydrate kinase [Stenomitos rutilans HA7619-LM2]